MLRSIVDSGADDALLMPFSSGSLVKKISALSGPRKPFVVTWDYLGPERRAQPRPAAATARHFEVPNPLFPDVMAGDYLAARDAARDAILAERLVRLAVQAHWLAAAIHQAVSQGGDPQGLFWSLEGIGRDLMLRLDCAVLTEKVHQFRILARQINATGGPLTAEDARRLLTAAEILRRDLGGGSG